MSKVLMKGNEAFAEAAIRAGCSCYFGYPITPQNEIPEYMSHELAKAGGKFIQAESELAAVNMAYGAAASGGRAFISTSSPGLALMQEGLGFIASCEVPIVALNVSPVAAPASAASNPARRIISRLRGAATTATCASLSSPPPASRSALT